MEAPQIDPRRRALALLPSGLFLLTAAFDNKRAGMLVRFAQCCATEPPLVCVAAPRGHPVDPLIRDSRRFALCSLEPADRVVLRHFADARPADESADPFDGLDVDRLATGAPVLARSLVVLDCEVYRHFDIEADHELFIGSVVAARAPDMPPIT